MVIYNVFNISSFFILAEKTYDVEVNITEAPSFYISKDWESKIYEGMAKCKVNGMKAWGITEWQYRNIEGRTVVEANKKQHLFN